MAAMRRIMLMATPLLCLAQTPEIHVDVREVLVSASVSTRDGRPVQNLRREDFTVLDQGQPREIHSFWRETDLPLTIGLIADVSGSESGVIGKHRETLRRFLTQIVGAQDRAFLVTVGNRDVKLVTDLTGSVDELLAGLDGINWSQSIGEPLGEACDSRHTLMKLVTCGTPLWDGIYSVARLKMKGLTGRKAMIVVSDGDDVGSKRSLTDAIEAAQFADTLVYTMRYVGTLSKYLPTARLIRVFRNATKNLSRLSEETGGRAYPSPGDPAVVFAEIENDLRSMYVLGFVAPEEADNGKFRKLELKVADTSLRVRARRGYSVSQDNF
jgi:Ca-activated chloride channel family protein